MKLLMTTDTVGGVWTYTMELCAALEHYGVDIELASMGRRLSPAQAEEVDRLTNVRLHESDYRLCWMHEPWQDVQRAGQWLLRLERELKPDLVQLNDLGHGGLPWRSPVVLVAHSCVYSWWQAVRQQLPERSEWGRYRAQVRASVQAADWVVAPTRAILDAVLGHYGPARVSMVIPNGRSYPPLARAGGPRGIQPALTATGASAVGGGDEIIFAAGRLWDEAKNIAQLVELAPELAWPVYVAGEEAEPGSERSAASAHAQQAHYLGFLDKAEMAQWLQRATLFVAPAHYEPFGLGILEAARAGCALVLGDIPSLREVWADAAVYVNPNDAKQLKCSIDELIRKPARRRHLAARAWQRAQVYSAERMAGDYMQCYSTLVHSPMSRVVKPGLESAGLQR